MENPFDMENDDFNEEYFSFCSSCNSILEFTYNIGVPPFFELNDENSTTQIETDADTIEDILRDTDSIHEDLNEYATSNINETSFVKNITNFGINSLIESYTDEEEEKNDDKIGCSTAKRMRYTSSYETDINSKIYTKNSGSKNNLYDEINSTKIARVNQDSEESKTYPALFNIKKRTSMLTPNLNDVQNYETSEEKLLKTTNNNTLIKSTFNDDSTSTNLSLIKSRNKKDETNDILNRRERIFETIQSILHLCDYINIMRQIIVEEIRKKRSG